MYQMNKKNTLGTECVKFGADPPKHLDPADLNVVSSTATEIKIS